MDDRKKSTLAERYFKKQTNWVRGTLYSGEEEFEMDHLIAKGEEPSQEQLERCADLPRIFVPDKAPRQIDAKLYPHKRDGYMIQLPENIMDGALFLIAKASAYAGQDQFIQGEPNANNRGMNMFVSPNIYNWLVARERGRNA